MKVKMKMKMKMAVGALLTTLLVACHSPQDNNEDGTKRLRVATNALKTLPPFESGFVSLLPYVSSAEDLASLELRDLELIYAFGIEGDEQCELANQVGAGFELQITGAVCEYEYTLKDNSTGQSDSGKLFVVASSSDEPVLAPLSSPQIIDEPAVIVITPELGYELSDEFILYGDGEVAIDSNNNEITYTGHSVGLDQILYSLVESSSGETKIGQINVSVANTTTTPIVAEKNTEMSMGTFNGPYSYDYSKIDTALYVSAVASDYSIVEVTSLSLNVSVDAINDKVINVDNPTAGEHWLSYLVSDGKGALDVGQIKVTVQSPSLHSNMRIISTPNHYLTTPPRAAETDKFSASGVRWRRCSPVLPEKVDGPIIYAANYDLLEEFACLSSRDREIEAYCQTMNEVIPAPNGGTWKHGPEDGFNGENYNAVSQFGMYIQSFFREQNNEVSDARFSAALDFTNNFAQHSNVLLIGGMDPTNEYDSDEYVEYAPGNPGVELIAGVPSLGPLTYDTRLSFYQWRISDGNVGYSAGAVNGKHLSSTIKPMCYVDK
ncbi:hypothetical protein [Psychromonas marina]|nr:hypothetical protein [Psychromonas marina]